MRTTRTPQGSRTIGRRGRRIATSIIALAMVAAISGPVTAIPMRQDPPDRTPVFVDPVRHDDGSTIGPKLRTAAGHRVLVFG